MIRLLYLVPDSFLLRVQLFALPYSSAWWGKGLKTRVRRHEDGHAVLLRCPDREWSISLSGPALQLGVCVHKLREVLPTLDGRGATTLSAEQVRKLLDQR